MEKKSEKLRADYKTIIEKYLKTDSQRSFHEARKFSVDITKESVSPEDMVGLHVSVIKELLPNLPKEVVDTNDLLLEVMVSYGLAYQEHQSLRDRQKQLDSELSVAAKMQQELFPKVVPKTPKLDIGIKSVAANAVSGDYYHFIHDEQEHLGVAVADIIGKGVPAALCMSMIKYALESLPELRLQPNALLENLNRVVEQNIGSNMFITMVFGSYDLNGHVFRYSGAGHEPGLYYCHRTGEFYDLTTKGVVLGLSKKAKFIEYEREVMENDLIILLSDGVTECRTDEGFLERVEITRIIKKYIHLSAQEMVDSVYSELEKIQNYSLKDDFTLMIIRRNV
ncbi:phosphoserine phosphatase [Anaerobacillus alkalidiazotrophicus]|uniref:Phosphoserine phosphatase n=1 Tax=Anaerobacillus alkalidiazotrophicus TaxID=472963 RepID=A0A1S2MCY3_9BACI|nr:PP2C family protein-serine/threonine phosphatase [Anaerobacillus alkalidiazotrophicus]OIJ21535.1 phosphoserine phosphatase [Anaerobacillus alkalidiazotrophicus]